LPDDYLFLAAAVVNLSVVDEILFVFALYLRVVAL
jgi:hypothetical protein